jgi:hypothetical protein
MPFWSTATSGNLSVIWRFSTTGHCAEQFTLEAHSQRKEQKKKTHKRLSHEHIWSGAYWLVCPLGPTWKSQSPSTSSYVQLAGVSAMDAAIRQAKATSRSIMVLCSTCEKENWGEKKRKGPTRFAYHLRYKRG